MRGGMNSLAQTLLKYTSPGVPDMYQGGELWDLSLVDPDNRRPVDYALRGKLLGEMASMDARQVMERMDEGMPKLLVVHRALELRNEHPEWFGAEAAYVPVNISGAQAELIAERGIKGSFGLICAVPWPGAQPLEKSGPEYIDWVKELNAAGDIEFWFHGWDHVTHDIDGEPHCEFHGRSYAGQKERFDRGQRLAQERLGFAFRTFGPGGAISKFPNMDETTLRVIGDDPHIRTILYPKPLDDAGSRLESEGKVTILDRVMCVNLERTTGEPDFNWFMEGYASRPDREYFVLQGHPNPWDDARFDEALKIIDFLIGEKAVFMTPSEYTAVKRQASHF